MFNRYLLSFCYVHVGHRGYEDKKTSKVESLPWVWGERKWKQWEYQMWAVLAYNRVLGTEASGKSLERKRCMGTESRKKEKLLTWQTRETEGHLQKELHVAKHWCLEQRGILEGGVWEIILEQRVSHCARWARALN